MSRYPGKDHNAQFNLGDKVSFDYHGTRLTGTVVRVYNTGLLYHVEVDGERAGRYEVEVPDDDPVRI